MSYTQTGCRDFQSIKAVFLRTFAALRTTFIINYPFSESHKLLIKQMRNCNLISLADYYRKVLNGVQIEDTGLDPNYMKKLELFMLYVDRDMLQTEITKKTGLSHSSLYKLKKVRSEHAISKG